MRAIRVTSPGSVGATGVDADGTRRNCRSLLSMNCWGARRQLKSHRKNAKEEARKRETEREALKAMLAKWGKLNRDQDRVVGSIQSMLPKTPKETLEELQALFSELGASRQRIVHVLPTAHRSISVVSHRQPTVRCRGGRAFAPDCRDLFRFPAQV